MVFFVLLGHIVRFVCRVVPLPDFRLEQSLKLDFLPGFGLTFVKFVPLYFSILLGLSW